MYHNRTMMMMTTVTHTMQHHELSPDVDVLRNARICFTFDDAHRMGMNAFASIATTIVLYHSTRSHNTPDI